MIRSIAFSVNLNANVPAAIITGVVMGGVCYIVHDLVTHGPASATIIKAFFSHLPQPAQTSSISS